MFVTRQGSDRIITGEESFRQPARALHELCIQEEYGDIVSPPTVSTKIEIKESRPVLFIKMGVVRMKITAYGSPTVFSLLSIC